MRWNVHGNTRGTTDGATDWKEPATRVAEEVARANGVDPLELDPLYDVLDPNALNELVTRSSRDVSIDFEYENRTVTVRSDGHVQVE